MLHDHARLVFYCHASQGTLVGKTFTVDMCMHVDDELINCNGGRLILQGDGNVVIYYDETVGFATHTTGDKAITKICLQGDYNVSKQLYPMLACMFPFCLRM